MGRQHGFDWQGHRQQYLELVAQEKSYADLEQLFGVSRKCIASAARRYGWPLPRRSNSLSRLEQWTFEDEFTSGLSSEAVGERLGRNANWVRSMANKVGIKPSHWRYRHTTVTVSRLLGVSSQRVRTWIKLGYLKTPRAKPGKRLVHFIDEEALLAFLENPRTWQCWQPEHISRSALRSWATELRNADPLLSTRDLAQRFHTSYHVVTGWFRAGRVPGGYYCPAQKRWCVLTSAVVDWQPPSLAGWKVPSRHDWTADDYRRLIVGRWEGKTWIELGLLIGVSYHSVFACYRNRLLGGKVPLPDGLPLGVTLVTNETAKQHRTQRGRVTDRYIRLSPERRDELRHLKRAGASTKDLAQRFHIAESTVRTIVHETTADASATEAA